MDPRIRNTESPWQQAFWANYILVLHAIAAAAASCLILYGIDGRVVYFNSDAAWFRRAHLQADDITTIVSTAILVVRILTGAWAAKSAWRCAFILLETQGITLQQFNRMISWPTYFLRGSTDAYITTLTLLLLVPANLVSPVITGAVGWKEVSKEVTRAAFQHAGPSTPNAEWYSYSGMIEVTAEMFSLFAASAVGVGWREFGKNNNRSSRLLARPGQRASTNATIDNLIMPFLEIHSISWDKRSDFDTNITDELEMGSDARSRITLSGKRPFDIPHPGGAVLFDEHFLDDYPTNKTNNRKTIPSPTVFRGTKKIALLIKYGNTGECDTPRGTLFGNKTTMARLKNLYPSRLAGYEVCFLIGTVNFTAGVVRQRATFIDPGVIGAEVDTSASIEGDNWVIETLYLLPDAMTKIAMLNISQTPTWDNLDGHVEDLIRISYQTTWGVLSQAFNLSPLNLTMHEFSQRLQAVVSLPRVVGWYCAQILVLVSAALLWLLQRRSNRPITVDAGVVALLVDATPILNKYDATRELSRMSYVMKRDSGTVRLAERYVPASGEQALLDRSNSKSSEAAPLVGHYESSTDIAKPATRFMLVPQDDGR